jgi:uncharacterized membrane protein
MASEGRQGLGKSDPGSETDSGSEAGNSVGRSAGTAVEGAAGEATRGPDTAIETPSMDFKAVLRDVQRTVTDEFKAGITQAATETVAPAARKAATSAVIYATTKAPGLVDTVVKTAIAPRLKEAGGLQAVAGGVLGKFPGVITKAPKALLKIPVAGAVGSLLGKGGRGGGELTGTGRGRRLPMQATIDVSVPVEVAYNQWTQFEDFPKFMFRVERVEQKDETHLIWHEKIWGVRRQWEAEIVEQRPDQRITWRSTSGPRNVGVISFHRLHDPRLTRVQVNLDFQPTGLIEKTGSGWRAAIRALDTDLQRFKAFVEMKDAATGAWRGRIQDAEVRGEEGEPEPTEGQPPAGEPAETEADETESSASRPEETAGEGES